MIVELSLILFDVIDVICINLACVLVPFGILRAAFVG